MSDKITIQDIIELLAEKHGMNKKDAEAFVKGIFDLIEEALASEKYVKVKGLGTFKLTEVESRESVNVNTGERFQIQGHNKISFTPDTTMKDLINKPFAHFETVILNENTQLEDTKIEMEGEDDKEENTEEIISSTPEILKEDDTNTITSTPTYEADIKPITNISDPQKIIAADEIIETVEEQQSIKEDHLTEKASKVAEDTSEERPATIAEAAIKAVEAVDECVGKAVEAIKEVDGVMFICADHGNAEQLIDYETGEPWTAHTTNPVPFILVNADPKKNLWGIIIAIILVLCIAGGIYWFMQSSSSKQPIRQSIPAATSTVKEMPNDSVTLQQQDTVSGSNLQTREPIQSQPAETPLQKQPTKPKSPSVQSAANQEIAKVTLADTVEYDIVGTKVNYTLQEGESLIKLALKFYGTKKLWPYIVRHNKNVIKDADRVPIGTTLRIPELAPKKQ